MANSFEHLLARKKKVRNVDEPPYVHVQSLGHCVGLDQHVDPKAFQFDDDFLEDVAAARDPLLWGENNRTLHGLNMHPRLGGWYCLTVWRAVA